MRASPPAALALLPLVPRFSCAAQKPSAAPSYSRTLWLSCCVRMAGEELRIPNIGPHRALNYIKAQSRSARVRCLVCPGEQLPFCSHGLFSPSCASLSSRPLRGAGSFPGGWNLVSNPLTSSLVSFVYSSSPLSLLSAELLLSLCSLGPCGPQPLGPASCSAGSPSQLRVDQ